MVFKSSISLLLLMCSLTACYEKKSASVELSGLNYTNTWITEFYVDGYAGHGISPNGGGGKYVCCVNVPRKWHKGMKVTIRWLKDDLVPNLWKEQVVEVPEYTAEDIGTFAVHFYPDDSVKVLVTSIIEGHPNYPYPRPK